MNAVSFLNNRISRPIPLIILIVFSLSFLLVYFLLGEKISMALVGASVLMPICIFIVVSPDFGFLLSFIYSAFFFFLYKHVMPYAIDIPQGVIFDGLLLFILLSYIINKRYKLVIVSYKNPVLIILIIIFGYFVVLIGNPAGSISSSVLGFRFIIRFFITIIMAIFFFSKANNFHFFIRIWFGLAVLAMLFGLYQNYVGVPQFQLKLAIANKEFYGLNFINGRWRIWSFLNNSTDFGLFMSTSAVFFMIYSISLQKSKRIILIVASLLMLLASSYSGTRTAIAIAVIGFLFFSLFEINNIKVLSGLMIGAMLLLIIIFGPIYNPTAQRVRSTFFPKDDPSYMMRENKMQRYRPYIYSHPFGGGLNSLSSTGHPLSGFPPDSYYLKSFLEYGVVGTLLYFILFIAVIIEGIRRIKNENINKYGVVALISSFFILTIAGYTQIAIYQFPYYFIFWGTIGYMVTTKK